MKSDSGRPVIIVGGGFSGTMAAVELARRGVSAVLVEGGGRAGRGTAYSTREPAHLLNVPSARMSAFGEMPDHFATAVADDGFGAGDFVPRARFGSYLRELLDEALAGGLVTLVEDKATAAVRSDGGWAVTLGDGRVVEGSALLLAQGNQPPEPLRVASGVSDERFVNNPWAPAAAQAVVAVAQSGGDVLILGTGLTMVDLVLSLDEAGHRGQIVALSRRGLVPRAHAAFEPSPVCEAEVAAGDVGAMMRWLRVRAGAVGWRAAVDALRPFSQAIWQRFDPRAQERFLRHARPWWDVHRHRIAPQVSERLRSLVSEARLEVVAGRVQAMREDEDGLLVEILGRGRTVTREERFAVGFNCTGPLGAVGRSRDDLLRGMIADGLVAVDRLGIGLAVDGASRAGEGVGALGPLTKGTFWEVVAVPDIRGQVARVADDVAKELQR
jgi:uncharacterized NAD(P)/FAD-binding protein YdhS